MSFFRSSETDALMRGLDRSYAMIEFDPTGKILAANANFLTPSAIRWTRFAGATTHCS
ncbi:hypothetical protein A6302_00108 [Methylobrevis pamukkalensis]|uniref:PAS fold protein n=1 Tax=Methylobrevis pamukkalensis TaxID=1439726 RepID=A0A1E3H906_9HYPH|nr:hypothetical protein A6302_00108 [Methylobrevis pamukkalensis]